MPNDNITNAKNIFIRKYIVDIPKGRKGKGFGNGKFGKKYYTIENLSVVI